MKMDDHSYNDNFPPFLQRHLEELFFHRQNTITLERFTIKDVSPLLSKQYRENYSYYSYHYTFKIPYAGKRLNWEVIFNPDDLSFAPDFCFNDDFLSDPDLDTLVENVPSLISWNVDNPKCLGLVLEDLLRLYKKNQLEKLSRENICAQVFNEYEIIVQNGILEPNNIELMVETNTFYFLMEIKVDTSTLPTYLQPSEEELFEHWLNPGKDQATLKIQFLKLDGSRVNVSLHLSAALEQILGNSKMLHIPTYTKITTLSKYVNDICKLLQDQVKRIEDNHRLKKEFITYICSKRIDNLVESDTERFTYACFLCDVDDASYLISIHVGDGFPNEKPTVTFQSAYCGSVVKLDGYPYSPRWPPEEITRRLLSYLVDAIPKIFNDN